jgi:SlyX protein
MPSEHVERRLTDLEIKASFTEDLVEQLNQIIIRQQQDLDALARQIGQLREQLPEPGTGTQGAGCMARAGF